MKDVKTSRCCVGLLSTDQKRIYKINQIRASALLDLGYVKKKIDKILSSDFLLIEGYFILGKYDIVDYLLTEYDNNGRKVAFNVSAPLICQKKKPETKNIFNHSNYIFATEEEINTFLGVKVDDMAQLSQLFHESLDTTAKKRHLILIKENQYLISSYDYSNDQFIKEFSLEPEIKYNVKCAIDLSGTRDGI